MPISLVPPQRVDEARLRHGDVSESVLLWSLQQTICWRDANEGPVFSPQAYPFSALERFGLLSLTPRRSGRL